MAVPWPDWSSLRLRRSLNTTIPAVTASPLASGSPKKPNKTRGNHSFENGKWVNFPATTSVTSKATYSVWVKSGRVGVNKFRVVSAKTASASVNLNITK